ncbi:MAG: DUF6055 domain-containing protein, partial [bacterium]|nr:DUF6055 domain-containing protein [bacterium]
PDSMISADQNFVIHYTTDTRDSVSTVDENKSGIPDRIEKIAAAFEVSYQTQIQQMGYPHPPSMKNGTAPYQIYVVDLHNQYARTVSSDLDSNAWEQTTVSSFILFDNDFKGPGFHIRGDDAIKVTAAHEFFHAIQLGYVFRKKDAFFFELTAVWMENQVFNEIENYLYYLDYFFSAPEIPLNGISFTIPNVMKHVYGGCIFGFYIEENFGAAAIRNIWEQMPKKNSLEAAAHFFNSRGSTFENEFVRFAKWNYLTGSRALTGYGYSNAGKFPLVPAVKDTIIEYYHEVHSGGYFLTVAYYVFRPVKTGSYTIRFSAEYGNRWRLGVIALGSDTITDITLLAGESKEIGTVQTGEPIIVIPCNVDRYADPEKIFFKETPEPYSFYLQKVRAPDPALVKSFEIQRIYPNPFSKAVTVKFRNTVESKIILNVYNICGQRVDKFDYGVFPPQDNTIKWFLAESEKAISSGVYFFDFSDGSFSEIIKVVFLR